MYPIMRSITGKGLRQTYDIVDRICKMDRKEFKTGEKVMDWVIPEEWDFNHAEIRDLTGKVLISTDDHLLHVYNYSEGFKGHITKEELSKRVTCGDMCIPYVTKYFEKTWGFCMTEEQWESLPENLYVNVDAKHFDGKMDVAYKEFAGIGERIIFSSYCCHPMMGNNELAGIIINAYLAKYIKSLKNRKNEYTFLFAPETIGAIAWMDYQPYAYDRAFTVHCCGAPLTAGEHRYIPGYGSNERQFGLNKDTKCVSFLTGAPEAYLEYHTSLDNLDFIKADAMEYVYQAYVAYIDLLEANCKPKRKWNCEPCLYKHGIKFNEKEDRKKFMFFWDACTGENDLVEIYDILMSKKCLVSRSQVLEMLNLLKEKNLLEEEVEIKYWKGSCSAS